MIRSKESIFRLLLLLVAAVGLVAFAACGDDEEDGGNGADGTPAGTPTAGDDLSSIPEDTTGITATEILLGSHMPLSGAAAALYGNQIVPGMQAYIDYINDVEGGVNGRKIRLQVEDDTYDPSRTNSVVRTLVNQDGIFALLSGLGTAQHSAVFDFLKEEQVPDLFTATGATKFTDPITRTAFGYNPNYIQEGDAIGKYIARTHPSAKLGLIIQNDDFGRDGEKGIRQGIEGSDVEVVTVETYEAVSTDLTAQVQNVRNAGADVLAFYALPLQAGSIISTAHEDLAWDVPIYATGVVADPSTIQLAGEANAQGVITTAYLRPLNQGDDPGVIEHQRIMAQYQPEATVANLSIYGHSVAELAVEVLKAAGPNLNRRSVIEAAESIRDFTCSLCLGPINLGPTDHRSIETFSFARAEGASWVVFGDLVSYETTE